MEWKRFKEAWKVRAQMKMTNLSILLTTVMLLAMTRSCDGVTVIDMTHQLKEGESITWPVNPRFNFSILVRGTDHALLHNVWVENNQFEMAEHTGTHLDAPTHVAGKGRWRMHQVPPERLVGPGVVIDVRDKVKDDHVYKVTVQDLQDWEGQHGRIVERAVVVINTGWASRYPDWNRIFNTEDLNDLSSFRFPSVSPEAASWLADKRHIIALGIDTPSPDATLSEDITSVHEILLPRDILILENVANVNSVPPTGTTIVLGAINIYDGSGAPMRMLAISGSWHLRSCSLTLAAMMLGMRLVKVLAG